MSPTQVGMMGEQAQTAAKKKQTRQMSVDELREFEGLITKVLLPDGKLNPNASETERGRFKQLSSLSHNLSDVELKTESTRLEREEGYRNLGYREDMRDGVVHFLTKDIVFKSPYGPPWETKTHETRKPGAYQLFPSGELRCVGYRFGVAVFRKGFKWASNDVKKAIQKEFKKTFDAEEMTVKDAKLYKEIF